MNIYLLQDLLRSVFFHLWESVHKFFWHLASCWGIVNSFLYAMFSDHQVRSGDSCSQPYALFGLQPPPNGKGYFCPSVPSSYKCQRQTCPVLPRSLPTWLSSAEPSWTVPCLLVDEWMLMGWDWGTLTWNTFLGPLAGCFIICFELWGLSKGASCSKSMTINMPLG